MLRLASLIRKRISFGVALVLPIAACSTNAAPNDRCETSVDLTPAQLADVYPEKPCEIVVTNGARTVRVEVTVATCSTIECDANCSSPDLQMGFSLCNRGGQAGGSLIVNTDTATGTTLGPFLGATQGTQVSVTITCGGTRVWSGQRGVCGVPM